MQKNKADMMNRQRQKRYPWLLYSKVRDSKTEERRTDRQTDRRAQGRNSRKPEGAKPKLKIKRIRSEGGQVRPRGLWEVSRPRCEHRDVNRAIQTQSREPRADVRNQSSGTSRTARIGRGGRAGRPEQEGNRGHRSSRGRVGQEG